jgi:hypothetical protein
MMVQIEKSEDSEYCKAVLATVALALQPLTLSELALVADLPEEISCSMKDSRHCAPLWVLSYNAR